jgi:tungstate transport system ATP-binding protein
MSLRLIVSNIARSHSGKRILHDCSFSFDGNDTYILMGPNGSGKSTFLRICALLEEPDSGEIKFFSEGGVLKNDINLRRRITLVLPKIGIFNTTVFQNVAYGLKVRGIKKNETEEKVHDALEFVGLGHKKNSHALSLSSGEAQRLGIARAIITDPEVLFLDEPTASLDPYNTTIIEELITKIKERNKIAIVMVTHNIYQAQRLADCVLFMHEGRIADHGAVKEFFARPKDERAYRFITGQMVY